MAKTSGSWPSGARSPTPGAGFLALLAALILVLALFLPGWLAALVVGLVVAGVGYFLVQKDTPKLTLDSSDLAGRGAVDRAAPGASATTAAEA